MSIIYKDIKKQKIHFLEAKWSNATIFLIQDGNYEEVIERLLQNKLTKVIPYLLSNLKLSKFECLSKFLGTLLVVYLFEV